jgi:hypothetical protein
MTQKDAVLAAREVARPHRRLFSRAILSILALTTPVFAAVYWLSIPSGPWPIVLSLHALLLLASILAVGAYLNTAISVGVAGVTARDYFGRTRTVTAEDVDSIVLLDVYESDTLETVPQLFVCDAAGRPLLRMRGQLWPRSSMQQVIDAFDCPVTVPSESVSLADLRRASPQLLDWFERGLRMPRRGRTETRTS